MAINLEDAFSYLNIPQEGIGSFQLPTAKPITPEYDVEFDIDDTGKIGLRSYLKEFGDTAKEGIGTFADKGMSLFDDSRKSNLMRAGLGSLLFGFSPLTAILGAVIGAKTPKAFDYFQQQEDRRAEKEAKRLRRESKQKTGKDHTPFRAKKIVPREDGKVGTVTPGLNNDHMISLTRDKDQDVYWRKITPIEAERLQTVPDNYTDCVSTTQRLKCLGNGWTIEVITHILKNMEL